MVRGNTHIPDSFPVSSCWYFYCKFEEGRLEREEVEAKGMMGRKGRREETGEDCLRGTKYELQTEKKTWRSVARELLTRL